MFKRTYREIVADLGPFQELRVLVEGLLQLEVLFHGLSVIVGRFNEVVKMFGRGVHFQVRVK
jgi:hypothetical protein